ncbi:MAG: hypothetical protein IPK77_09450 [Cellvibrio sp.]|nr:hypothetical protein [Cellvibrio sp.]
MKNILSSLGAGALGAFAMCLVMWLSTKYGVTHALGVAIQGSTSPEWIYPRIVWGGLWGLLFLLPLFASSILARSFVLALIPTLVQLFIIFPYYQGKGIAGLNLGLLTPFVVFFFFWVWSLATSLILKLAK